MVRRQLRGGYSGQPRQPPRNEIFGLRVSDDDAKYLLPLLALGFGPGETPGDELLCGAFALSNALRALRTILEPGIFELDHFTPRDVIDIIRSDAYNKEFQILTNESGLDPDSIEELRLEYFSANFFSVQQLTLTLQLLCRQIGVNYRLGVVNYTSLEKTSKWAPSSAYVPSAGNGPVVWLLHIGHTGPGHWEGFVATPGTEGQDKVRSFGVIQRGPGAPRSAVGRITSEIVAPAVQTEDGPLYHSAREGQLAVMCDPPDGHQQFDTNTWVWVDEETHIGLVPSSQIQQVTVVEPRIDRVKYYSTESPSSNRTSALKANQPPYVEEMTPFRVCLYDDEQPPSIPEDHVKLPFVEARLGDVFVCLSEMSNGLTQVLGTSRAGLIRTHLPKRIRRPWGMREILMMEECNMDAYNYDRGILLAECAARGIAHTKETTNGPLKMSLVDDDLFGVSDSRVELVMYETIEDIVANKEKKATRSCFGVPKGQQLLEVLPVNEAGMVVLRDVSGTTLSAPLNALRLLDNPFHVRVPRGYQAREAKNFDPELFEMLQRSDFDSRELTQSPNTPARKRKRNDSPTTMTHSPDTPSKKRKTNDSPTTMTQSQKQPPAAPQEKIAPKSPASSLDSFRFEASQESSRHSSEPTPPVAAEEAGVIGTTTTAIVQPLQSCEVKTYIEISNGMKVAVTMTKTTVITKHVVKVIVGRA